MKTLIVCLVLISCCSFAYAGPSDSYDKTTDGEKIAWMDKGMALMKSKLKDPHSAEFRNVYFHRGRDGAPVTCGEINSKNSFGGYSGFQRFLSAGTPDLTVMEEQMSGFEKVWDRLCQ